MNTVHLCSYELISEALKKVEVSSRIPFKKIPNVNKVLKDVFIHGYHGLVVTEGEEWNEQRKFAVRVLRNFGFGKTSLEAIMQEELTEFSKRLEVESKNGPVDLSNKFNVMVINVLWRIIGGHRFDYDDEKS